MLCPKCGRSVEEDAVICPACDFILDTSFLGDDIRDDERAERPGRGGLRKHHDFGDAVILGDGSGQMDAFDGDAIIPHMGAHTGERAHIYVSGASQAVMAPDAIPAVREGVDPAKLRLTPFERHLLQFIDGQTPVHHLQSPSGMDELDIKTALATLADKGVVHMAGRAFADPPPRKRKAAQGGKPATMTGAPPRKQVDEPDQAPPAAGELAAGAPSDGDDNATQALTREELEVARAAVTAPDQPRARAGEPSTPELDEVRRMLRAEEHPEGPDSNATVAIPKALVEEHAAAVSDPLPPTPAHAPVAPEPEPAPQSAPEREPAAANADDFAEGVSTRAVSRAELDALRAAAAAPKAPAVTLPPPSVADAPLPGDFENTGATLALPSLSRMLAARGLKAPVLPAARRAKEPPPLPVEDATGEVTADREVLPPAPPPPPQDPVDPVHMEPADFDEDPGAPAKDPGAHGGEDPDAALADAAPLPESGPDRSTHASAEDLAEHPPAGPQGVAEEAQVPPDAHARLEEPAPVVLDAGDPVAEDPGILMALPAPPEEPPRVVDAGEAATGEPEILMALPPAGGEGPPADAKEPDADGGPPALAAPPAAADAAHDPPPVPVEEPEEANPEPLAVEGEPAEAQGHSQPPPLPPSHGEPSAEDLPEDALLALPSSPRHPPLAPPPVPVEADAQATDDAPAAAPHAPPQRAHAGQQVVHEKRYKARQIFQQALKDIQAGNVASARMNAKLAAIYDPAEQRYKDALTQWTTDGADAKGERKAVKPKEVELFEQAQKAEQGGDHAEAVRLLKAAIDVRPESAQLWNRLGVVLATRLKLFDEAVGAVQHALELDPQNASFMNNLGKILAWQEDAGPTKEKRGILGGLFKR